MAETRKHDHSSSSIAIVSNKTWSNENELLKVAVASIKLESLLLVSDLCSDRVHRNLL